MPTTVDCPTCSRKLRVPDELLGKKVKCPQCGNPFTATASTSAPAPVEEGPRSRRRPAPAPPPVEDELPQEEEPVEDEPRPRSRRGGGGSGLQPHRGTLVLILGIASVAGYLIGVPVGFLGIFAWLMGNHDLKEMAAGRMDPEGEGNTKIGKILGIIGTVLFALTVLCICGFLIFYIVAVASVAGANSSMPPHPAPIH